MSELLPRIAYITWMNAFLNVSFLMMVGTVVINLVVGVLDQQGRSEVGDRIDYRCRWIFPLVYFSLILLHELFVLLTIHTCKVHDDAYCIVSSSHRDAARGHSRIALNALDFTKDVQASCRGR